MKNILLITSSPRGEASHSTRVATELAGSIPGKLTLRELWRDPPAAIGPAFVHAVFTPEGNRTAEQRAALALSDEMIAELREADVVVIAAGMINFGMPTSLKTWIDLISRNGETFRYDESGPEGLLKGKRVVLVLSYGGVYSSGPMAAMDHMEPALRSVLSFLGMTDIETVRIEGVAFGEDAVERAMADAKARTQEVLAHVH